MLTIFREIKTCIIELLNDLINFRIIIVKLCLKKSNISIELEFFYKKENSQKQNSIQDSIQDFIQDFIQDSIQDSIQDFIQDFI